MELTGRSVLVTGGTGFVGSHLVERLVAEGCSVRVLANYRSRPSVGNLEFVPPEVLRRIDVRWGDVCDRDSVDDAMEGVSVVFHLAALIGIPYSYRAPGSYVQTNIVGTLNVLQTARTRGIDRLVHTSTSEVYGSAQYVPMDEKHPLVGQSPYAATKIGADQLVESFHRSFGLPTVTVRPFNVYGPRQSDRAVIPTIIAQRVLAGDDVHLGNPDPKRDFTYVTDTVNAFVRSASSENTVGRTLNIGSGKSISIGDLARRICELTGGGALATTPERARPDRSEVDELQCDNRSARDLLDWRPTVALTTGLTRTIEFVRAHPSEYTPGRYVV